MKNCLETFSRRDASRDSVTAATSQAYTGLASISHEAHEHASHPYCLTHQITAVTRFTAATAAAPLNEDYFQRRYVSDVRESSSVRRQSIGTNESTRTEICRLRRSTIYRYLHERNFSASPCKAFNGCLYHSELQCTQKSERTHSAIDGTVSQKKYR